MFGWPCQVHEAKEQTMTREELLATLRARRGEWEALLAQVDEERMTTPGVEDAWSIKDIIAHITAYERWVADQLTVLSRRELRVVSSTASEPGGGDARAREAVPAFAAHHRRSLAAVQAEAAHAFARLSRAVALLPEETLAEERRYGWTGGRPVWRAVAGDTYEHYDQHAPVIRAWLARQTASEAWLGQIKRRDESRDTREELAG
jgi:hypothetical protein